MRGPCVAVDAPVLAPLIRIDRLVERNVGRLVVRDDRPRALDRHRGLERRQLLVFGDRRGPAVVKRLALFAAKTVGRIESGPAALECGHAAISLFLLALRGPDLRLFLMPRAWRPW